MIVRFTVYGEPQPQGSKTAMLFGKWTSIHGQRALINPRAMVVEGGAARRKDGSWSSTARARHRQWRTSVELAAVDVLVRNGGQKIDGPLSVEFAFYLTRPKSTPLEILYPAVKPDLDKLERAANDGLRPLIAEDSRIVRLRSEKFYADTSPPRMIVQIETLPRTRTALKYEQLLAADRNRANAIV